MQGRRVHLRRGELGPARPLVRRPEPSGLDSPITKVPTLLQRMPSLALEVDSRLRVSGLPCQEEEREVELAGVCERAENAYRDAVVAGLPDDVVGTLFEIADERRQNCWIADANEHGRRLRGGHAASPLPGHLFLSIGLLTTPGQGVPSQESPVVADTLTSGSGSRGSGGRSPSLSPGPSRVPGAWPWT